MKKDRWEINPSKGGPCRSGREKEWKKVMVSEMEVEKKMLLRGLESGCLGYGRRSSAQDG